MIGARLVDRVQRVAHTVTQALPETGRNPDSIGGGRPQRIAPHEH